MNFFFQPWQLLVMILAAWINREQHKVIDYLRMENQILRDTQGSNPGALKVWTGSSPPQPSEGLARFVDGLCLRRGLRTQSVIDGCTTTANLGFSLISCLGERQARI
jgi:hypothetical protein